MKRKLFLCLVVALISLMWGCRAEADIVDIKWDATARATGYMLSYSIDYGVTWTDPLDVGDVLTYPYDVPDTGLVMIKVGAYNATGITWRKDAGVFYNGDWKPLLPPSGVGAI